MEGTTGAVFSLGCVLLRSKGEGDGRWMGVMGEGSPMPKELGRPREMGLFRWSRDGKVVLMVGSDGGGDAGGDGPNGWVEDDRWREAVVIFDGIGGWKVE